MNSINVCTKHIVRPAVKKTCWMHFTTQISGIKYRSKSVVFPKIKYCLHKMLQEVILICLPVIPKQRVFFLKLANPGFARALVSFIRLPHSCLCNMAFTSSLQQESVQLHLYSVRTVLLKLTSVRLLTPQTYETLQWGSGPVQHHCERTWSDLWPRRQLAEVPPGNKPLCSVLPRWPRYPTTTQGDAEHDSRQRRW